MVFKRKIYKDISEWKERWGGKYALLIKGARRIGKSTIAEAFGKNEYRSYILVNFQTDGERVRQLFFDTLPDMDSFYRELSLMYGTPLYERESLIIFDEVQLFPRARETVKQITGDGRYDLIETGSLISIKKNVKDILIPSEEKSICMHPMDFEEFLWARGDTSTMPLLRENFEHLKAVGDSAHRKIMKDFRLYMVVGGMPQAVAELLDSNDFFRVDEVKRGILELYESDLKKLDTDERLHTSLIFKNTASELSSNSRLFRTSAVIKNGRPSRGMNSFDSIEESMTINTAYNCANPSAGLSLYKDLSRRKIYLCDTGLLVTQIFEASGEPIESSIYSQLILDKININLGMITENMTAQQLVMQGYELFFHRFGRYEIDFLLRKGKKLIPIEVKSSSYTRHKSLDEFRQKYSSSVANESYVIYGKDLRKEGNVIYLPFYMAGFL